MKKLYYVFVTILIVIFTALIVAFNGGNGTEFTMFAWKATISTQLLILCSLLIGFGIGILFMLQFVIKGNSSIKAYERRLEKTSVSNDSSTAKIKVLEAKIEVLEKALDDALKNQ
ncbi:LapA family protein [bacterium]|nr:LapA family protein [bacterium]